MQFPSMVELAQELSARGDYTSAQILTQLLKAHDDLQTENAALKSQAANANLHSLNGTGALTAQLDQTADMLMLESMKAMDTLRAALAEARPDHMAHLCNLAHSAVSLMILPPFARDAHKLRADGTLEPQTKDTP